MIESRKDQFLWVEKYRPRKIEDCILPQRLKSVFSAFVEGGRIPNMLLCGSPGTGKTTVARALCDEVDADLLFVNASNETGIDVFRTKILQFASSVSLSDSKKVVILDEFDHASPNMQAALRAGMEEVSKNCTFILTCNFKNRVIEPLHSRCSVIDFKVNGKEKAEIAAVFFKRVIAILEEEGVRYEKKVVAELVQSHFPDFRRVLNELQRYSSTGEIDTGVMLGIGNDAVKSLMSFMKAKDFAEVRKWVTKNSDNDTVKVFREVYDAANDYLQPGSVPQLILILAEYQYRAAFVADPEINMVAAFTEIMSSCSFQ